MMKQLENTLPPSLLLGLYYKMLRIRMTQLRIESLYHFDEMKTPIHLCIGQEAIAVGVCANLNETDYVSSNHRGHGHYLAKGGDLKQMIAELYCRETGCSKGHGGSMHLVDESVGLMGSSSIVGGGIPIGTGLGLAIKMKREDRVSVVFFGDGAADEGVVYESINFAILKKLPVIFVLENNQFSVCSRVSKRWYGESPFHKIDQDFLLSRKIDGNSVIEVYMAIKDAVIRARSGNGPSFIECVTYRMRGHAGSGDAPSGYRDGQEIEEWVFKCPLTSLEKYLKTQSVLNDVEINSMSQQIESELNDAFAFAQESPLPQQSDVGRFLFKESQVSQRLVE